MEPEAQWEGQYLSPNQSQDKRKNYRVWASRGWSRSVWRSKKTWTGNWHLSFASKNTEEFPKQRQERWCDRKEKASCMLRDQQDIHMSNWLKREKKIHLVQRWTDLWELYSVKFKWFTCRTQACLQCFPKISVSCAPVSTCHHMPILKEAQLVDFKKKKKKASKVCECWSPAPPWRFQFQERRACC